jgi:hypothetical protein
MQYSRAMTRWVLGLALLALAGCDEKKEPAATTVAPATTPTTTAVPPAPGEAAKPSGEAVAPSGEAAKPSGEAAKPSGEAVKPSGAKVAPGAPSGMMPHGSVRDGTVKYNPPPGQNPPPATDATKK